MPKNSIGPSMPISLPSPGDSTSPPEVRRLSGSWVVFSVALCAILLLLYPGDPAQDDALRLIRGLDYYSVVAQQPHFPGYPSLMMVAKLLYSAGLPAYTSLQLLSLLGYLLSAVLLAATQRSRPLGWLALLATLSLPLLIHCGLSGLSDSLGSALLLGTVLALRQQRWLLCFLVLGLAVGVRPGLGIAWLYLFILLCHQCPAPARRLGLLYLTGISSVNVWWMWQADAGALVTEAWRFLHGHFSLWGHAQAAIPRLAWLDSIGRYGWQGGLLLLLAALPLRYWRRQPLWLTGLWLSLALWTLLAQNPEHLRHLLPLTLLGLLYAPAPLWLLLLCLQLPASLWQAYQGPVLAPWQQATLLLRQQPQTGILLSRQQPLLLRQALPQWQHIDPWYAGELSWASHSGAALWQLSSQPPSGSPYHWLAPRWLGEEGLYLSRANAAPR